MHFLINNLQTCSMERFLNSSVRQTNTPDPTTIDGEPANDGVAATEAGGDIADASRNVSLCFFWPFRSGQSL
jgi:hypothetical protein